MGAASAIAAHLPGDAGSGLLAAAGDAFTRAMGIGLVVAAAVAAVTAVAVRRFLPGREDARLEGAPPEGHASAYANRLDDRAAA